MLPCHCSAAKRISGHSSVSNNIGVCWNVCDMVQVTPLDAAGECVQLLRQLSEAAVEAPVWRRQRPHLMVEGATYQAATDGTGTCTLALDAYVRNVGLSANQVVAVPEAGDFGIGSVLAAPEQVPLPGRLHHEVQPLANDADLPVLAKPDEDRCVTMLGGATVLQYICDCVRICTGATSHETCFLASSQLVMTR